MGRAFANLAGRFSESFEAFPRRAMSYAIKFEPAAVKTVYDDR